MKRYVLLLMAALLALCAAGCSAKKETPQPAASGGEESSYVTAFGAVTCAERLSLELPAGVKIAEVYAREGQALAPNTPVLKIDMARLLREKERAGHELAAAEAAVEGCRVQIGQAEADLSAAQSAAGGMDADALLGILDRLARASGGKRDAAEGELLEYLKAIDSVGLYRDLVALTADRRRLRGNARPALLELEAGLEEACRARQTDLNALLQKLEKAEADVLPLREKADIMEGIAGGAAVCGIGSFDAKGVFTTGGRPLMLLSEPPYPGQAFPSGATIAGFGALDTLEIRVNVEEQLIPGVAVGADVQLSPLYDKGTVWLGTVAAVSGRAIEVNGETVVPVTVTSEDMALGPGYNVTVKIYPPD